MGKPILIVEDSADDAAILQLVFTQVGVLNPVQVVVGGNEAVAYLKGEFPYFNRAKYPLPGIIFLDLKLPGIDGFEFMEWIRAQPDLKDVGVVVISGVSDLDTIRRAYTAGAKSFVPKPCNPEDLQNLIRSVCQSDWKLSPPPSGSSL